MAAALPAAVRYSKGPSAKSVANIPNAAAPIACLDEGFSSEGGATISGTETDRDATPVDDSEHDHTPRYDLPRFHRPEQLDSPEDDNEMPHEPDNDAYARSEDELKEAHIVAQQRCDSEQPQARPIEESINLLAQESFDADDVENAAGGGGYPFTPENFYPISGGLKHDKNMNRGGTGNMDDTYAQLRKQYEAQALQRPRPTTPIQSSAIEDFVARTEPTSDIGQEKIMVKIPGAAEIQGKKTHSRKSSVNWSEFQENMASRLAGRTSGRTTPLSNMIVDDQGDIFDDPAYAQQNVPPSPVIHRRSSKEWTMFDVDDDFKDYVQSAQQVIEAVTASKKSPAPTAQEKPTSPVPPPVPPVGRRPPPPPPPVQKGLPPPRPTSIPTITTQPAAVSQRPASVSQETMQPLLPAPPLPPLPPPPIPIVVEVEPTPVPSPIYYDIPVPEPAYEEEAVPPPPDVEAYNYEYNNAWNEREMYEESSPMQVIQDDTVVPDIAISDPEAMTYEDQYNANTTWKEEMNVEEPTHYSVPPAPIPSRPLLPPAQQNYAVPRVTDPLDLNAVWDDTTPNSKEVFVPTAQKSPLPSSKPAVEVFRPGGSNALSSVWDQPSPTEEEAPPSSHYHTPAVVASHSPAGPPPRPSPPVPPPPVVQQAHAGEKPERPKPPPVPQPPKQQPPKEDDWRKKLDEIGMRVSQMVKQTQEKLGELEEKTVVRELQNEEEVVAQSYEINQSTGADSRRRSGARRISQPTATLIETEDSLPEASSRRESMASSAGSKDEAAPPKEWRSVAEIMEEEIRKKKEAARPKRPQAPPPTRPAAPVAAKEAERKPAPVQNDSNAAWENEEQTASVASTRKPVAAISLNAWDESSAGVYVPSYEERMAQEQQRSLSSEHSHGDGYAQSNAGGFDAFTTTFTGEDEEEVLPPPPPEMLASRDAAAAEGKLVQRTQEAVSQQRSESGFGDEIESYMKDSSSTDATAAGKGADEGPSGWANMENVRLPSSHSDFFSKLRTAPAAVKEDPFAPSKKKKTQPVDVFAPLMEQSQEVDPFHVKTAEEIMAEAKAAAEAVAKANEVESDMDFFGFGSKPPPPPELDEEEEDVGKKSPPLGFEDEFQPDSGVDEEPSPLYDDEDTTPLAPFPAKFTGEGWELMLRHPIKKKIMADRCWKPCWVRLTASAIILYNTKKDAKHFMELPFLPTYCLSNVELNQYDVYGKIHTVKLQHVVYKERVGIRPGQIPKLVDGQFSKLGLPLEHAALSSQLLKFGSLNHAELQTFVQCVEDMLFGLNAHRERPQLYKQDEIQVQLHDEYSSYIDKDGCVQEQLGRVRVFCLTFLSGMPFVEIGLNDRRRQGKETVRRKDIMPMYTERWIRFENVEFHKLLDREVFAKDRLLKLQPLDGCFTELLRFRVRPPRNRELPLKVKAVMNIAGSKVEIRIECLVTGFKSRKAQQVPCEDIQIRFPIPEPWIYLFREERYWGYGSVHAQKRRPGKIKNIKDRLVGMVHHVDPSLMEVAIGDAKYEHVFRSLVWRIGRLPEKHHGAYKNHLFRCRFELSSFDVMPETYMPNCEVEYTMPVSTVSNAVVRSISLDQHDNPDAVEKWVRYLAKYQHKVEIDYVQVSELDMDAIMDTSKVEPESVEAAPHKPVVDPAILKDLHDGYRIGFSTEETGGGHHDRKNSDSSDDEEKETKKFPIIQIDMKGYGYQC